MTKTTAALLALTLLTITLVTGCRQISIEALTADNCDTVHNAKTTARSIQQQLEANPIRFDDRIAGNTICVKGRASNIKWGLKTDEETWLYINPDPHTKLQVECSLNRADAANIEEHQYITIRGKIPSAADLKRVTTTTPLEECTLIE